MTLDFLGKLQRTHTCGELRSTHSGETVTLMGWVNRRRDHGNLIFLDLRDRTGITQVVLDKEVSPEAHAKAEAARPEYVVAVTGVLRKRGEGLANPNMPTGDVELVAHSLLLLNDAKTPPFPPKTPSPTRKSASNTVTSTSAAPRCRRTSSSAARSRWPFATTSSPRASSRSKLPS